MLKKLAFISVALLVILSVAATIIFWSNFSPSKFMKNYFAYKLEYETLKTNAVSVEIVEINEASSDNLDYNILMTIDKDKIDNLLYDVSKLEFRRYFGDPAAYINGRCIKVSYSNGNYELICDTGARRYNKDNRYIGLRSIYCPEDDFEDLIDKYLKKQ